MKTIREWFAELPKELEEKAVKAVVEQLGEKGLEAKYASLDMALCLGFNWEESDEKGLFWENVAKDVIDRAAFDARLLSIDNSSSTLKLSFAETSNMVCIWAEEKGIAAPENWPKQFVKLNEEVGELAGSILKGKREEELDAFGDCMVVLTILAKQRGVDLEKAFSDAYQVIKDRQGKLVDGTFVKDEG